MRRAGVSDWGHGLALATEGEGTTEKAEVGFRGHPSRVPAQLPDPVGGSAPLLSTREEGKSGQEAPPPTEGPLEVLRCGKCLHAGLFLPALFVRGTEVRTEQTCLRSHSGAASRGWNPRAHNTSMLWDPNLRP